MIDTGGYERCTDQKATIFDKYGSGIGGWIDCAHQRGSKSIDSSNWCCACFNYYGGEEE